MRTERTKIFPYILIVVSILIVAGLGSLFVNLGMNWFDGLRIPTQFPPNFIIPIVWSVIYIVFAIVLCVWYSKKDIPLSTIILLVINGIFNVLWCLIFFALNQTFGGVVSIVILLILAYLLVVDIYKSNKLYALFTAIYPVWVSIATTLNIAMWILN